MSSGNETFREEVKKEFQLERMILFSDAVFAIVITLMAIEIHLPEAPHGGEPLPLPDALMHLLPVIVAYAVSFFFIGAIWYQHLRLFSVLKDYDVGLVVRNLVLLFLVGLFPFSATVVTHGKSSSYSIVIYLSVIYACVLAQYALQYYVLKQRPALRMHVDLTEHLEALRRRRIIAISMAVSLVGMLLSLYFITDPATMPNSVWWIMVMPLSLRIFGRKKAVTAKT